MALPKGFKHSEATRLKIKTNNARYWLGKKRAPVSQETREKLRLALSGRSRPPEVREKIILNMPRGKQHHAWAGGRTPLRERIWHSPEYRAWRTAVFKRDNYVCTGCFKQSGVLNADHYPKTLRQILIDNKIKTTMDARKCRELWDVSNGRTLCLPCHRKTATWGKNKI